MPLSGTVAGRSLARPASGGAPTAGGGGGAVGWDRGGLGPAGATGAPARGGGDARERARPNEPLHGILPNSSWCPPVWVPAGFAARVTWSNGPRPANPPGPG